MPTFGVSAGLPNKHRLPKAGDVWLEGQLKVQRWGLGFRCFGVSLFGWFGLGWFGLGGLGG